MALEKAPRATRIVCTLGPASSSRETLEGMIRAGMDVARFNFSHGTHQSHRETARLLRETAGRLGRHVALLQDLQGHKVRVGEVEGKGRSAKLELGREVRVGFGDTVTSERVGIDYQGITRHVSPGDYVYLDDGSIELKVRSVSRDDLVCEVVFEGEVGSRKGVIFPGSDLEFPLINDKDLEDARVGVEMDADMVAMSFVRSAAEIHEMRGRLRDWGARDSFLVAKIEDRRGIENLDEILDASDAVLVARGDLGVTLPREKVPGLQRRILRSANERGVPSITATQMLESMKEHSKPTRAEVSDVHNAVVDGSDAVMLSGETATGRYPVRAVAEMDRIARAAELETDPRRYPAVRREKGGKQEMHDRMAAAAARLALEVKARCVLGYSLSGSTLRSLSSARCPVPVYGVVTDERVLRRLLLHRGLSLSTMPLQDGPDELIAPMLARLEEDRIVEEGDRVLVVAGKLEPRGRRSYLLKVYEVG